MTGFHISLSCDCAWLAPSTAKKLRHDTVVFLLDTYPLGTLYQMDYMTYG